MPKNRWSISTMAIACTIVPAAAHAQAGNYYLDSVNPANGFTITLPVGIWDIGVIDGAWSPWNYVEGCDAFGGNCHTGFHTIFYYKLGAGPQTPWGIDGSQFESPGHSDFYATPALALPHAFGPLELDITTPTLFDAYIPDCCYYDNTGGLTVRVSQNVTPEPATMTLLASGLVGIAAARRQRRKNNRVQLCPADSRVHSVRDP